MAENQDGTLKQILALFRERGDSGYGGEAVSQREHALQAAHLARQAGASPTLVAAALLHDLGHLLHHLPEDAPDHGIDDGHEDLGARWLAQRFTPDVVEPIRLHVAAKRYLCTVELDYLRQLSEPSLVSLALQGGSMTSAEIAQFQALPHFEGAVALRRWDDAAKVPGWKVPEIEAYVNCLEAGLQ